MMLIILIIIIITSWRPGVARGKKHFFLKINFFLAYNTLQPPMSVHTKIQPNRSSCLAGYAQHIYDMNVVFYYIYIIINVKTAEQIESKFSLGPYMTPGKVYGCSILQKFVSKLFFIIVLYCKKRRCSQTAPQLKFETEDGHEAP